MLEVVGGRATEPLSCDHHQATRRLARRANGAAGLGACALCIVHVVSPPLADVAPVRPGARQTATAPHPAAGPGAGCQTKAPASRPGPDANRQPLAPRRCRSRQEASYCETHYLKAPFCVAFNLSQPPLLWLWFLYRPIVMDSRPAAHELSGRRQQHALAIQLLAWSWPTNQSGIWLIFF